MPKGCCMLSVKVRIKFGLINTHVCRGQNKPKFSNGIWAPGITILWASPNFKGIWLEVPPYFKPWMHAMRIKQVLCHTVNLHHTSNGQIVYSKRSADSISILLPWSRQHLLQVNLSVAKEAVASYTWSCKYVYLHLAEISKHKKAVKFFIQMGSSVQR